ncbi:MAG: hypothetical protein AB7O99_09405 [Dongiaceae bacterium]
MDGHVYIDPEPEGIVLRPGDLVQVLIEEADDYDLYGQLAAAD